MPAIKFGKKSDLYFLGRRNYGYSMDRPFRRPSGNRGPRHPYYSHGNKGGPRQRTGCLLFRFVLMSVFEFLSFLANVVTLYVANARLTSEICVNNFVGLVITSRLRMDEDVQMNGDEQQRSVMSVNRRL